MPLNDKNPRFGLLIHFVNPTDLRTGQENPSLAITETLTQQISIITELIVGDAWEDLTAQQRLDNDPSIDPLLASEQDIERSQHALALTLLNEQLSINGGFAETFDLQPDETGWSAEITLRPEVSA